MSRGQVRNALREVICDVGVYPPGVGSKVWGADMSNVLDKATDAVMDALTPEMEYALEETKIGEPTSIIVEGRWSPYLDATKDLKVLLEGLQKHYIAATGRPWYSYKVVQRPKALPYTEVVE